MSVVLPFLVAACVSIDADTTVDAGSRPGWTPLLLACEEGHAARVEELLNGGLSPDGERRISRATGGREPVPAPILLAASAGHLEVVRVLLDHGAKVDARDDLGWTALHHAVAEGRTDVATLLLDDPSRRALLLEAEDACGWRPMHVAAANGGLADLDLLLSAGASRSVRSKAGFTPWLIAWYAGGTAACAKLERDAATHSIPGMQDPEWTWRPLRGPFRSRKRARDLGEPALSLVLDPPRDRTMCCPAPLPPNSTPASPLLLAVWLDGTVLMAPDRDHPCADLLAAKLEERDVQLPLHLLWESGITRLPAFESSPASFFLRFGRGFELVEHAWKRGIEEPPPSVPGRFEWRRFTRAVAFAQRCLDVLLPSTGVPPLERAHGSPFRGYRFDAPWRTPWME